MAQLPNWEFYRFSSLGLALLDTVDEMVRDGALSGDLANIIMARFDESVGEALRKKVHTKCSFTAKCSTFNLVDEVYRFSLKNVRFKMEGAEFVNVPSLKIIAVKSGITDEGADEGHGKGSKKALADAPKPLADMQKEKGQGGKKGKGKKKGGAS